MIGTVLFVPDIMNYLSIGKYLPTYLLTFVYESGNNYGSIVVPLILNIICFIATYIFAITKVENGLHRI